jgi:hypothetical protein
MTKEAAIIELFKLSGTFNDLSILIYFLTLTIDANLVEGRPIFSWKVRVYYDHPYSSLINP